ncbi:TlyA family RNA methyltransferase [Labrys wisconsinensis]|uniref:23S rRNA (Cytidine1920-2'-O)/16S rRNA (Cytidine1409-2'-O)-methyltransferase n=1 Tax=Labrys wisconsinensis TaxID=425677 RepID=A0ABU0J8I3_9HYPH|nr:TlyA family RNA methyltransferase [Labrys wisconsinensis]MDQ0470583.1 23S rRNA (cytidine1920-2'-O)/16S rRNA (cytidine1409-2'-O)-methyltransferase [Labrys wisconsinensis]
MTRQRADLLLVERGYFDSRARAQAAIAAGLVTAGGAVVRKASEAIAPDAEITAAAAHPWVSRGGVKLAHALETFAIPVEDRIALDVGASTGGFSQVLLERGAARVYAVDSGHGQLHPALRRAPCLVSLEGVDARRLSRALVPDAVDLVVIDVSFISLTLVLQAALNLAAPAADLVALVKPQFEAGREHVGKGGIVREEAVHHLVCERIVAHVASLGWRVRDVVPSPIAGGDGNREFLLAADRRP